MWPMIALAGASMASGLLGNGANLKAAAKAIEAESRQVEANNKALIAETARAAGEIRRQQTYETIRTAQALLHTKAQAADMVATTNVSEAMVDRVGSSALAVRSDIQRQADTAEASIWDNNELMNENTNVAMQSMLNQAKQSFSVPGIRAPANQTASIFAQGLIGVGAAYLSSPSKPKAKR